MIAIHPHFLVNEGGRPIAVQVPLDEFRSLVLAVYEAGKIGEGEAATMLGVSRPEYYALALAAGMSTCSYTPESVEAEIANLGSCRRGGHRLLQRKKRCW
jgi:hypothetical protein